LPAISLALVSGLYFALTVGLTIDWNDEGQIAAVVFPGWLGSITLTSLLVRGSG
jgi:hypothetical protein